MGAKIAFMGTGAVGGYAGLAAYTSLGGTLTVFALPNQ